MLIAQYPAETQKATCLDRTPCDTGLPKVDASSANLQIVLQFVFGIIGALTVLLIIINAMRLISSEGNPQEATKARQGIIYALVGLAIALSAEAIVTFVLGNI